MVTPVESTRHGRFLGWLVGGPRERIAGSVYGTIVVLGVLAAGSESATIDAWELDVFMIGTVIVLWIAHVYAHGIAQSVSEGIPLDENAVRALAAREISIVLAAVGPGIVLLLGAVGLIGDDTAVALALGVGTLTLAIQGLRYAKATRLSRGGTLWVIAVNVALGLFIVGLKVLLEG
jgi:hypothetical protein